MHIVSFNRHTKHTCSDSDLCQMARVAPCERFMVTKHVGRLCTGLTFYDDDVETTALAHPFTGLIGPPVAVSTAWCLVVCVFGVRGLDSVVWPSAFALKIYYETELNSRVTLRALR